MNHFNKVNFCSSLYIYTLTEKIIFSPIFPTVIVTILASVKWLQNKFSFSFGVYIFNIYTKCYKGVLDVTNSSICSLSQSLLRTYHVLVTVAGAGNNTLKDTNPVFKKPSVSGGRQALTHRLSLSVKSSVNLENTELKLCQWAVFKVTKSRFVISSLFTLYILSKFQK